MLIDAIKQHGKKQIEVKQKIRITDKTKNSSTELTHSLFFPVRFKLRKIISKKKSSNII